MTAIALILAISLSAEAQDRKRPRIPLPQPQIRTVTVGSQSGKLTAGDKSGTATFAVTTRAVDVNAEGSVQWFSDEAGTKAIDLSTIYRLGIKPELSRGAAKRSLKVTTNANRIGTNTPAGIYYFRVTIDDVQSNIGKLVIDKSSKEMQIEPAPYFIDKDLIAQYRNPLFRKFVYIEPYMTQALTIGDYTVPSQKSWQWYLYAGGDSNHKSSIGGPVKVTTIYEKEAGTVMWYSDPDCTKEVTPPADVVTATVSSSGTTRTVVFTSPKLFYRYSYTYYFRVKIGDVLSSNVGSITIQGAPA